MARSTGPVLAIGGVAFANKALFAKDKSIDWRIPIATGIAAGMFALLEKANEGLAVGLAWVALVTVLLVRIDPKTPAPLENVANWMK
jgi:hypothetical protein